VQPLRRLFWRRRAFCPQFQSVVDTLRLASAEDRALFAFRVKWISRAVLATCCVMTVLVLAAYISMVKLGQSAALEALDTRLTPAQVATISLHLTMQVLAAHPPRARSRARRRPRRRVVVHVVVHVVARADHVGGHPARHLVCCRGETQTSSSNPALDQQHDQQIAPEGKTLD